MALPRSKYVQEGQEGVYHCFSRCVRRAFLYGFDPLTRRDFSHRKAWLVDRLRYLAAIFAIEVCAYAVLENHYHTILRTRPDIVALWSDREVATRWLTLFPRQRDPNGTPLPPAEKEIRTLADCPERIAELRRRLCATKARKGGCYGRLKQPCCTRDEGGSLGLGLQGQGPNHRKLLWSNGRGGERFGKGGTNPSGECWEDERE